MTTTAEKKALENAKPVTGHGRGKNRDEPRNSTVCFTVTESEQTLIDALGMCINLRRSAILTEIVTRFVRAVEEAPRGRAHRNALNDFLDECQQQVSEKRDLFDGLTRERERR